MSPVRSKNLKNSAASLKAKRTSNGMSNNSRAINITLPDKLLEEIDKAAKGEYASRSDFIRESVVRRLKNQRVVDEWGDEGNWETVVDFRDLPGGGMPAEELVQRLKRLNGQNK